MGPSLGAPHTKRVDVPLPRINRTASGSSAWKYEGENASGPIFVLGHYVQHYR